MMKTYRLIRYYGIILLLFCISLANSQTDNEFWFAAPDITPDHWWMGGGSSGPGGEPVYLTVANTQNFPTFIRISMPANPIFDPIEFILPANGLNSVDLTPNLDQIENRIPGVNPGGLLIESRNPSDHYFPGAEITAYYHVDEFINPDIFTLKGKNSLGQEFFVTLQREYHNGVYSPQQPISGFIVVSTEDNTMVTIVPKVDLQGGYTANTPMNITLNRGETFAGFAMNRFNTSRPAGTRITSNKPVAVTIYDDSMQKIESSPPSGCSDLMGDQTIPVDILGLEYLVMRGQLVVNERIFIMPVEDNTEIFINDTSIGTYDAGAYINHVITVNTTHVRGSKKIYVYHMSGFGCEVGGAILPTIDGCTGSLEISFVRTNPQPFFLNLMVRNINNGTEGFIIEFEDGSTYSIHSEDFESVESTGWSVLRPDSKDYTYIFRLNEVTKIRNTNDVFHMGILSGLSTSGTNYGFFSNYAVNRGEAIIAENLGSYTMVEYGDTVQLIAKGGLSYSWEPTTYISDPLISNPFVFPPEGNHEYEVTLTRPCFPDTTMKVYVVITDDFPLIVNTTIPASITNNSALLGGEVTEESGTTVIERGVVYSLINPNPEIGGENVFKQAIGSGIGSFSQTIESLEPGTTYYFKAYALNERGAAYYGDVESFKTNSILTVTVHNKTVTYGDLVPGLTYSITGFIDDDDESVVSGEPLLSAAYASTTSVLSSPVDIEVEIGTLNAPGYFFELEAGQITIENKELEVIQASAQSKVYDGKDSAIITGAMLVGVINGDDVNLEDDDKGIFHQVTVGTDIPVSTSMSLAGSDKHNYIFEQLVGLKADITPKVLYIEEAMAQSKVYDGTDSATITGALLVGVINDDDVDLSGHEKGIFHQVSVGTDIPVSTSMNLAGSDKHNYIFEQLVGLKADITPMELFIGGNFTAYDKVYDGTKSASIKENNLILLTPILGDDVGFNDITIEFDDAEYGDDKLVTIKQAFLDGTDKANYLLSLEWAPTANANINPVATQKYNLTINISGNGRIIVNNSIYAEPVSIEENTTVGLEALPDQGWQFTGWSDSLVSTNVLASIIMDTDKIVSASFNEISLNLIHTSSDKIIVYPNPFNSHITIKTDRNINYLYITNVVGKKVVEVRPGSAGDVEILTEDLEKGIYFLILQTIDGQKIISKLMKR